MPSKEDNWIIREGMEYIFEMEEGECWWGGSSDDGTRCPFDKNTELVCDFRIESCNQTMPMYLSDHGRCIWSEDPFGVKISAGVFTIEGEKVVMENFGSTLREAYVGALNRHFLISGEELPEEFFTKPQYNTWMQYTYNPTQEGVLQYAHDIIRHGFMPGIMIIDEGWQKEYGLWEFDPVKFPDPKAMIDELHSLGFIVMVWIVPSVRPDGPNFVKYFYEYMNPELYDKLFLRNVDGEILLTRWWNGYSATFDLTKTWDAEVLDSQLKALMQNYGVDGFKFDGGRLGHYEDHEAINGPVDTAHTPAQRNIAWNEFGTKYRYHEFKDTFKGGGKRVIQRIHDRSHSWSEDGLNTLIPNAILQGIIGHPFICPDMIGGGSWIYRDLQKPIDEELFVRMAQCSALFPMMQFSWAPWEAVSQECLVHIKAAHDLHVAFAPKLLELVQRAYDDGEPILRSLAYNYPNCGYEYIMDQFMLGEDILVAPVIERGVSVRKVVLPEGVWMGYDQVEYKGGRTLEVPVGIETLPFFCKEEYHCSVGNV